MGFTFSYALDPGSAGAQEFERNIMTGSPTGTYIQIGRDIGTQDQD